MFLDIGIVGSARIGSILARHLAALGHQVHVNGPARSGALILSPDVNDRVLSRDMLEAAAGTFGRP